MLRSLLAKNHHGRPPDPQGDFGVAFCRARLAAGLSQEECAKLFGRHRVTISRWEISVQLPRVTDPQVAVGLATLNKLAKKGGGP
jgi:transcriptional regulator with XRE-family HTH domain